MVQRANGEPGALRELADTQVVVGRILVHATTVRPDAASGSTTWEKEADRVTAVTVVGWSVCINSRYEHRSGGHSFRRNRAAGSVARIAAPPPSGGESPWVGRCE
jgi:hypothetical protein